MTYKRMLLDRGEFIKAGFFCFPSVNGGWIVSDKAHLLEAESFASFSTFADMIAWLEDQHEGLKIGEMAGKGRPEGDPNDDPSIGHADMRIRRDENTRPWTPETLPPNVINRGPAPDAVEMPCGYGCTHLVTAWNCPVHGASDA